MADKAQQILKAAEKQFATTRYHEVTLDGICQKAGVGKGTIYRYFKDKEDLYYRVLRSGLDELTETIKQVGQQEEDPRKGLRRVATCMVDFFTQRAALFGLMYSEQLKGSAGSKNLWRQWHQRGEPMMLVASDLVRKGIEQGLYATDFKPEMVARLLLGMIRVAMRNRKEMPAGEEWPASIVQLFERGLLVEDARKSSK